MYALLAAADDGTTTLWRTPADAVSGAPIPYGSVLLPWGRPSKVRALPVPPTRVTMEPSPPLSSADEFCAAEGYVLLSRRAIPAGDVLFVRRNDRHYVVKRQQISPPVVSFSATPCPAACEMRAIEELNALMAARRVAPVFCERLASHHGYPVMRRYVTDLADWARGDGKTKACAGVPTFAMAADRADAWLYTRCAGMHLATSRFPSDRRLFNDILRATLLQVSLSFSLRCAQQKLTKNYWRRAWRVWLRSCVASAGLAWRVETAPVVFWSSFLVSAAN